MQDTFAQAIPRLLHPWSEQSWHEHRLLPCHSLYLGECRDKSLASAGRQKTLHRWRRLPERDHSQPCAPPWKKTTPADEMSGFSDVIPDGAQQGAIPLQYEEMRLTAARRQPCASQPGNKFPPGSGSDVSCYVITGSAVVIRTVGLVFFFCLFFLISGKNWAMRSNEPNPIIQLSGGANFIV